MGTFENGSRSFVCHTDVQGKHEQMLVDLKEDVKEIKETQKEDRMDRKEELKNLSDTIAHGNDKCMLQITKQIEILTSSIKSVADRQNEDGKKISILETRTNQNDNEIKMIYKELDNIRKETKTEFDNINKDSKFKDWKIIGLAIIIIGGLITFIGNHMSGFLK